MSKYDKRFVEEMTAAENKAVVESVISTSKLILREIEMENAVNFTAFSPNLSAALETAGGNICNLAESLRIAGEKILRLHKDLNKTYHSSEQ